MGDKVKERERRVATWGTWGCARRRKQAQCRLSSTLLLCMLWPDQGCSSQVVT